MIQRPPYFDRIQKQAQDIWESRERGDAEAQQAIKTLFEQVQNPHHVVSELIQNADDAGATWVSARIEDGAFVFRHNGRDFTENDFAAISRFAYSNKRHALSIGFRGIGFRSIFSFGSRVELTSPTLSVYFDKERFTVPCWFLSEREVEAQLTEFRVPIERPDAVKIPAGEIAKWQQNPYPLLFLKNVRTAQFEDDEICIEDSGKGPTEQSSKKMITGTDDEILLFKSGPIEFPEECKREIRETRRISQEEALPPAEILFFISQKSAGKIFVFLPAVKNLPIPVSFHAPFIQLPDRSALRPPSQSRTNEWLLKKTGEFIGSTFLTWLGNTSLSNPQRAQAYSCMIPPENNLNAEVELLGPLSRGFHETIEGSNILLTTSGDLSEKNKLLALPDPIDRIWTEEELLRLFGHEKSSVLSPDISGKHKKNLEAWGFFTLKQKDYILQRLTTEDDLPATPDSLEKLFLLWRYVESRPYYHYMNQEHLNNWDSYNLVPVLEEKVLRRSKDVIVLPDHPAEINEQEWDFISSLVCLADSEFLEEINRLKKIEQEEWTESVLSPDKLKRMLSKLNLGRASKRQDLIRNAAGKIFATPNPDLSNAVLLTQLAYKLSVELNDDASNKGDNSFVYRFLCGDGEWRDRDDLLLSNVHKDFEEHIPLQWYKEHSLSDAYFDETVTPNLNSYIEWLNSSEGASLLSIPLPQKKALKIYASEKIRQFCAERYAGEYEIPKERGHFEVTDYVFDEKLTEYWFEVAKKDDQIWFNLLRIILTNHVEVCDDSLEATIVQIPQTVRHPVKTEKPVLAEWVALFRNQRSLMDQNGNICNPCELLLSNKLTKPYYDYEGFVHPVLDEPKYHLVLKLLGVRDSPASADALIDQLKSFSRQQDIAPEHLGRIRDIYRVLQKLLPDYDQAEKNSLREAFEEYSLVLCDSGWAPSSRALFKNELQLPGFSSIHPEFAEYANLFNAVGVKRRPEESEIYAAIATLEGKQLTQEETTKLQAFMYENPPLFLKSTYLWLSCEGILRRAQEFDRKIRRPELLDDAYSQYKRYTADISFLGKPEQETSVFDDIKWIEGEIDFKITVHQLTRSTVDNPLWHKDFGALIMCIGAKEGTEEILDQDRAAAKRLSETEAHYCSSLAGHLTLSGAQASDTKNLLAKWTNYALWINQGDKKFIPQLIRELRSAFKLQKIRDAVSYCIFRSGQAIREYCESNFDLSWNSMSEETAEAVSVGKTESLSTNFIASIEPRPDSKQEELGNSNPVKTPAEQVIREPVKKVPHAKGPLEDRQIRTDLSDAFLDWAGFEETEQDRYENQNGRKLIAADKPFHFIELNEKGNNYIWLTNQPYRLDKGMIIPALIWERSKVIDVVYGFADSDRFKILTSEQIGDLLRNNKAELVPTEYVFRSSK